MMMKNIFLISLICISSLANAQTNRQRLDDIEDKLDDLILQQEFNEIERRRRQNEQMRRENNKPSQSDVYKNNNPESLNREFAREYNIPYHDYIRKDEFSHNKCINFQYRGDQSGFYECYASNMIGISIAELKKREYKSEKKCNKYIASGGIDWEKKFARCIKEVVVLGK